MRLYVARRPAPASSRVHTYSSYARGNELLIGSYNWLDLTARGRQEDWEPEPRRGNDPFMSWLRRHDEYEFG